MNTKHTPTEETIKVPSDMLIDILAIILKEGLKYEVTQVIESRRMVLITICPDEKRSRQVKAIQNIQDLLATYNDYRFGQQDSFNWREA